MSERDETRGTIERAGAYLDRFIASVNPSAGERRAAARLKTVALERAARIMNSTSHRGASTSRGQEFWNPSGKSADADNLPEIDRLRRRSRDTIRNNPVASGMVDVYLNNVVRGGLEPRARVDAELLNRMSPEKARKIEQQLNRFWWLWAPRADICGRMTFGRLQRLVARQMFENGDVLVLRRGKVRWGSPLKLAIDVVEGDRVSDPAVPAERYKDAIKGKEIVAGVELDGFGAPVAYWVQKSHPAEYTSRFNAGSRLKREWVRVPAYDRAGNWVSKLLYGVQRPGQTRGVPALSPVLEYFYKIERYIHVELVAAELAACFSVFIKKDVNDTFWANQGEATTETGTNERKMQLYPGLIQTLAPGEDIQSFIPGRPSETFDPFVKSVITLISAGCGLPRHLVMSDFENMNYSNVRAAITQAWYQFGTAQQYLEEEFCGPVWNEFIRELSMTEQVVLPGYTQIPDAYQWPRWTRPGRDSIDPQKEAQADAIALQNLTANVSDSLARRGKDLDDHVTERAAERDAFESAGLKYQFGKTSDRELTKDAGAGDRDGSDPEPEESDESDDASADGATTGARNGHAAVR